MQINHPILQFKNVSISYTPGKNAVNHVNADIKKNRITAIMGPSGCGKSTLLRAINRMHELYPDIRISGEILMDNRNILKMNPMEVRRMAGIGIGDVAQIVHCLEHALARFGTQLLVLHVVDHVGDGGGGDACGFGHIAKRHALPGSCIQRYRLISLSRNLCD